MEFSDLLHQMRFPLLIQVQLQNLLPVDVQFVVLFLAQLVLQHADLSPQNLIPLSAGQLIPDLALHLVFKAQDIALPGKKAVEFAQAKEGREFLQNLLLIREPQIDVLRDEVRQIPHVLAIHDCGDDLLRHAAHQSCVFTKKIPSLAQQRLCSRTALKRL